MKNFYAYPMEQPFNVLANARGTDSININDQYDFMVQYITYYCATEYAMLLQLRVNNTNYFNDEILTELIAGNGQRALYFPLHAVFHKSDRIQIDWQNITGADKDVYLVFLGYEIKSVRDIKKPAVEA